MLQCFPYNLRATLSFISINYQWRITTKLSQQGNQTNLTEVEVSNKEEDNDEHAAEATARPFAL